MAPWARLSFTRTIYIYVLAAFSQPANILLFPRITHKSLRFSLFFNIYGTQWWVNGFFPGDVVRHLRSRHMHSYTHRRSRPTVTIVRPLWGPLNNGGCAMPEGE